MPSFKTEVPHQLGKEKAVERLSSFLDGVAEKYKDQVSKMDGTWSENVLEFSLTTCRCHCLSGWATHQFTVSVCGQHVFSVSGDKSVNRLGEY